MLVGNEPVPLTNDSPPPLVWVIAARRRLLFPLDGVRKRYVWPVPGVPGAMLLSPKSKMRCQAPLLTLTTGFQVTHASTVKLGPMLEMMCGGNVTNCAPSAVPAPPASVM